MLPSRASDAGPDSKPRLPGDIRCSVAGCESHHHDGEVWQRCQGAVPDLCTNRMCHEHLIECIGCDLPCCADHSESYSGGTLCNKCAADSMVIDYDTQRAFDRVEQDLEERRRAQ